ncbi:MAG: hypothetical protein ACJAZ3_000474, partial [Sphingobacteriales bacterium]
MKNLLKIGHLCLLISIAFNSFSQNCNETAQKANATNIESPFVGPLMLPGVVDYNFLHSVQGSVFPIIIDDQVNLEPNRVLSLNYSHLHRSAQLNLGNGTIGAIDLDDNDNFKFRNRDNNLTSIIKNPNPFEKISYGTKVQYQYDKYTWALGVSQADQYHYYLFRNGIEYQRGVLDRYEDGSANGGG